MIIVDITPESSTQIRPQKRQKTNNDPIIRSQLLFI